MRPCPQCCPSFVCLPVRYTANLLNSLTNLIKSKGAGAKVFELLRRRPRRRPDTGLWPEPDEASNTGGGGGGGGDSSGGGSGGDSTGAMVAAPWLWGPAGPTTTSSSSRSAATAATTATAHTASSAVTVAASHSSAALAQAPAVGCSVYFNGVWFAYVWGDTG